MAFRQSSRSANNMPMWTSGDVTRSPGATTRSGDGASIAAWNHRYGLSENGSDEQAVGGR